jgi:hypothetical protein
MMTMLAIYLCVGCFCEKVIIFIITLVGAIISTYTSLVFGIICIREFMVMLAIIIIRICVACVLVFGEVVDGEGCLSLKKVDSKTMSYLCIKTAQKNDKSIMIQ